MLRRRCLRTAFAGGLAAAILCTTPALAAPPTAGDDSITARPRGTIDVLANDTGAGIQVAGNGQPAHGSASCAPLGGCLYKADAGYTGPDSFTYTLRDSDATTVTGTVQVTVGSSSASSSLIPTDDDAATLAGRAVDIKVLDNDGGAAPLTVTGHTAPSHGSVSCTAGGTCTYTPADGFTGADGFRYTVHDAGNGPVSTADVHLLVVAADARYALGLGGNPSSIGDGDAAQWTGSISGVPSSLALEELAALPLPDVTLGLSGPQAVEGAVKTAKGWTASDDATHASAGASALLGSAVSEAFPRPLPPINTGTGGDGHVPILVGSKIFAFFHHSSPTSVSCIDRRTGEACPGYPMALPFNTSNINGPAVVLGTKIYTHIWPFGTYSFSGSGGSGGYAQTSPVGLLCWDAATNDTCGYHVLARRDSTNPAGASAPIQVGNRIYMAGDGGKLYCLDPATNDPCGSIDTGLTPDPGEYDVVGHGTRVYISRSTNSGQGAAAVVCVDVAGGSACPGWETPKSFGRHWNVINQHNAEGAVVGVCVVGEGTADCLPDADPGSPTHIAAFVPNLDDYYDVTQEAETGTRTFFGSLQQGGVGCWDWATGARCTGGGFDANGWAGPGYRAYGATWDGSCVVALGDSSRAFTVDAQGNSPCTSLSSGTNKRTIDLRDQRFDRTVGNAHWNAVTLHDVAPGELTSVIVTVRDAGTGEALASGDLVGGGPLDLSGIDPVKHPAVTLDATSTEPAGAAGPQPADNARAAARASRVAAAAVASAWDDAIPPRLRLSWTADPQQIGFATRSSSDCSTASGTVLGAAGHLAGGDTVGAQVALTRSASCGPPKPVTAAAVPRVCSGARLFSIHVRYKGSKIRKLTVTINGKKQIIRGMRPRPIVRIDLRKLARSTVKVKITIQTKSGKFLRGTRVYHPCTKKLPDRGFKY